ERRVSVQIHPVLLGLGCLAAPSLQGDPDEPTYSGTTASRPSTASSLRDALIKKGLIYSPDHGAVDFTVPHFSPFMRRRYPLEAIAGDTPAGGSAR
ncbi:MAG: hypothetical protein ACYDHN_15995, partial [Solirubrobacteraceae bacterium]